LILAPALPEAEGVKLTEHVAVGEVAVRRIQLVALKLPVTPVISLKAMVPVGVVAPTGVLSVTVAVQVAA
jgi:hypothetical protein